MVGLGCSVDINCVIIEELEGLNGVGKIIVMNIVEFCIVLGGFFSIEDLKVIFGIGCLFIDVYKDGFCCLLLLFLIR